MTITSKSKFVKYLQKLFNVPKGKAQWLAKEFDKTQYLSYVKPNGDKIEIKHIKIDLSKVKQDLAKL